MTLDGAAVGPEFGGEVDVDGTYEAERAIAQLSYDRLGIGDLLRKYAFGQPFSEAQPRTVDETDLDIALHIYAIEIAAVAYNNGVIQLPQLREGFNLIIDGMNGVAGEKLGHQPPTSIWDAMFIRAGLREPEARAPFDGVGDGDQYWEEQFLPAYGKPTGENILHRRLYMTDGLFLAKHFHHSLHGFALAPFSFIQQADSKA